MSCLGWYRCYFLLPELRAAVLVARAAKLPFATCPPLLRAVEDCTRLAAAVVIGVRAEEDVVFLVIIFTFVVKKCCRDWQRGE